MSDERLNEAIAEYLEAEDAGQAPDRREFVARHPEIAGELEAFFANQDDFHIRTEPLGPIPPASQAPGDSERPPFWLSPGDDPPAVTAGVSPHRRFGDYDLIDELARGAMGVVYRARHIGLGRIVGLKMILAGPFASSNDLDRFRLEAQASAMLDHPNLVPIYEVGEFDGQPFFTMKLVEGRSLADRLSDWKDDPRSAAQIVAKIASAVHYAHQRGVLHRDLKPANIVIDSADEPHVTDFGLAKVVDSQSDLTQSGAVLGTPSYMAPEQAAGSTQQITTGADVYSLGAILYAMLTSRPPFRAVTPVETLRQVMEQEPEPPSHINRHIDADLETICLKSLEKEPRQRYGSAEALADDLGRWLTNQPIQARRSSGLERVAKWARRKPALAALVAVSAVAMGVFVAGTLWSNQRLQAEIRKVAEEHATAQANFDRSEEHRIRAELRERIQRRHLYAAHMHLAQQAWESGRLGRMRQLLDEHRPDGTAEDVRGFEWYFLWRLGLRGLNAAIPFDQLTRRIRLAHHGGSVWIACEDGTIRELELDTHTVRSEWQAHVGPVNDFELTPDDQTVVSIGGDGLVRAWDRATTSERWAIRSNSFTALALSRDGTRVALTQGSHIMVFDMNSGKVLQTLPDFPVGNPPNTLTFSASGRFIVSAGNDGVVRLWDTVVSRQIAVFRGHRVYIKSVAFAPDEMHIASADEGGRVIVWQLFDPWSPQYFAAPKVQQRHSGSIDDMCFSADGTTLATAGEDGIVCISDSNLDRPRAFGHTNPVRSIAFSPESATLISAESGGTLRVWDESASANQQESVVLGHHTSVVYAVSFARDGKTVASGSQDRTMKRWQLPSLQELPPLLGHSGSVVSMAFSPRDDVIASANAYRGTQPVGPGSEAGSVRVWDANTGRALNRFDLHPFAAWGLAFAPDGRTIATSGYLDKTVKLTDVASGQSRGVLTGHPERLFCVAYSPDGQTVAAGGFSADDHSVAVSVWNTETGAIQCQIRTRWVWSVAFSPDGKTIATGSDGGIVKLWDVATGVELHQLRGHTTTVKAVAFAPDGKSFATGSADQTIKLWDLETGEERATLMGHTDWVSALAFSPDSRSLASGDWHGEVRLWLAAADDHETGP